MVTVSIVTATAPSNAIAGAPRSAASGDFSRALAGAGAGAGAPDTASAPAAPTAPQAADNDDERQDLAADGKDLPDKDNDDDQPADDADAIAPDLTWLTGPTIMPAPPSLPLAAQTAAPALATPADNGFAAIAASSITPAMQAMSAQAEAPAEPSAAVADQSTPPATTPAPAPPAADANSPSDRIRALSAALCEADAAPEPDSQTGKAKTPAQPGSTAAPAVEQSNAKAAPVPPVIAATMLPIAPRRGSPAHGGAPTAIAAVSTPLADMQADPAIAAQPVSLAVSLADPLPDTQPDNATASPTPAAPKANDNRTPMLASTTAPDTAPAIGVIQSAARAFASSIAATIAAPAAAGRRNGRDPGDELTGSITAAPALAGMDAIARAADATPTVDTRHGKWVEDIISHIEVLRDGADAQDTRIRLLPDALGKIDVSLHRDGDAVNVRFTADRQETRQLLADAQPRLNEIAASRGIRIGQSTIDSGQGNARQHQPENPHQPTANRRQANGPADEPRDPVLHDGWIA